MNQADFEKIVGEGIAMIPEKFLRLLENVAIVIEDEPSFEQLAKLKLRPGMTLFGLYEGVPQTKRGPNYGMTMPDKITIFKKPIEEYAATPEQLKLLVKDTVWHEIAHHFGMDEERVKKAQRHPADYHGRGRFAVAVMIESPEGIPLVMDPQKPRPYWKFPGGRSEDGESPEAAAIREIDEEVGIKLAQTDLLPLHREKRINHDFYFFKAAPPSLAGLKNIGADGEKVRVVSAEELKNLTDFFPNHKKLLRACLKSSFAAKI